MNIFISSLLALSFIAGCSLGFRPGSSFSATKTEKKSFVGLRCIPELTQPASIEHLEDALLLQGRSSKSSSSPTADF
jgi:hypothetical protein